jgi:hypothetical protein
MIWPHDYPPSWGAAPGEAALHAEALAKLRADPSIRAYAPTPA